MASINYNKSGTITVEDSGLQRSIQRVLAEDAKKETNQRKADLRARKSRHDLTLNETILEIGSAASDTLSSYPGSNGPTGDHVYPKPAIQSADRYYGDVPGQTPRLEPNIENDLESKERQMKLYLAARELSRMYSQIIDDRRTPISDRERVRSFMKDLMGALTSE